MTAPDPKVLCTTITKAWQDKKLTTGEACLRMRCPAATFKAITEGNHPMTLIEAAEFGLRLGLFPGNLMRAAGQQIPGRP